MSHINHRAIKAIEAFEQKYKGQYAESKSRLVINVGHDGPGQVMANASFDSVAQAIAAVQALAEEASVIGSIEAIINNGQQEQRVDVYPPNDDGDHVGRCCGGCGG